MWSCRQWHGEFSQQATIAVTVSTARVGCELWRECLSVILACFRDFSVNTASWKQVALAHIRNRSFIILRPSQASAVLCPPLVMNIERRLFMFVIATFGQRFNT